jgi:hypothetical protein
LVTDFERVDVIVFLAVKVLVMEEVNESVAVLRTVEIEVVDVNSLTVEVLVVNRVLVRETVVVFISSSVQVLVKFLTTYLKI